MLASVLLWVGWRRWRRRRASIRRLAERAPGNIDPSPDGGRGSARPRTLLAGTVILAVAALASVGAAAVVPTAARTVLRSAVAQPFDPRDYPSPLSAFRKYLRPECADQVMLTATGLPAGALIRIATLDHYDGVVYAVGSATVDSASGTFVRIPTAVDQSAVDGKQATVDVTVDGYSGVWIPTVGQLRADQVPQGRALPASPTPSAYNDTSGTAATVDGIGKGDRLSTQRRRPNRGRELAARRAHPGSAARGPSSRSCRTGSRSHGPVHQRHPGTRASASRPPSPGWARDGYISHGLSKDEPPSRSAGTPPTASRSCSRPAG